MQECATSQKKKLRYELNFASVFKIHIVTCTSTVQLPTSGVAEWAKASLVHAIDWEVVGSNPTAGCAVWDFPWDSLRLSRRMSAQFPLKPAQDAH
uniref:Uncharacterized protein n=1 Tax=Ornithodoros brasiliensis TaxID=888526 RepID=A0A1D2AHQ7_ORNBR